MIHAPDYSNMDLDQMNEKVLESKEKDRVLSEGLK